MVHNNIDGTTQYRWCNAILMEQRNIDGTTVQYPIHLVNASEKKCSELGNIKQNDESIPLLFFISWEIFWLLLPSQIDNYRMDQEYFGICLNLRSRK